MAKVVDKQFPLSGVRVLEFGQLIAIPSGTQQLAELGADVIKVEPPGGEVSRNLGEFGAAIFMGYNRGKRSISLDLKDPSGTEVARKLMESADVLCHNFRPGTMERLGLGTEQVRHLNPRIVNISVSGYGPLGPSSTRAGLDIAAQAESGLMSITGEADQEPQRVGAAVIDVATGYMVAQAVLAALLRRSRTGQGEDIRISLLDIAIHLQTMNWVQHMAFGIPMRRTGNGQPAMALAAEVFRGSDGYFILSAYTQRHFKLLCGLIGQDGLSMDPRFDNVEVRLANRSELHEIVAKAFAGRAVANCVGELLDAGLVAARIYDYDDVPNMPDVTANKTFVQADAGNGTRFWVPVPPARSSLYDSAVVEGRVPMLGEHTNEVLAEFGLASAGVQSV